MTLSGAIAPHLVASGLSALLVLAACGGDDDGGDPGAGAGGSGTSTAASTSVTSAGPVAVSSGSASSGGQGGSGQGGGGQGGGGQGGFEEFFPTPESIDFAALGALPAGEQILFNDWNAFPNVLLSMGVDGSAATAVFEAFRIWSMGVSLDGSTIAFSSADPEQEEHFGLGLGDAIQHTFLYDTASEAAVNLTRGNINDECHQFSADGERLYVCRRYDFRQEGDTFLFDGWRVGRVDLADGSFEFLQPEFDDAFTLSLQPDAEEATGVFQRIDIPSSYSLRRLDLETGDDELLREDAGFPVLSPDGTRVLFSDYTDQGALRSDAVEGGDAILVVDRPGSNARWSPDGTRVAYLLYDDANACSHVEIAAADGSQADAPVRIRDCVETGEFISELSWIVR